MNLLHPHGTLTTLLCAAVEPGNEDLVAGASLEYARIAVQQMVGSSRPMQETVECFGQDFASMTATAQAGVQDELTSIALWVLLEFRRTEPYSHLDSMLDDVRAHGLLGDAGMYRVTRWLAEESWAGCFEPPTVVGDTLEGRTALAQTTLVVAAMACRVSDG